jgi:rhodanese-related sulfurtransferase
MKSVFVLAAAAMLFVGAESALAQCHEGSTKSCCANKSGATMTEVKKVGTRSELSELMQTTAVTVVDARDADSYQEGHIDGAVSLAAGATLPEDKNSLLVFYCGGTTCPLAEREARKAMAGGYTNVVVYSGGWADWANS